MSKYTITFPDDIPTNKVDIIITDIVDLVNTEIKNYRLAEFKKSQTNEVPYMVEVPKEQS